MNDLEQFEAIGRDLIGTLDQQEEALRRICLYASVRPLEDWQLPLALHAWQCGARTLIRVTDVHGIGPAIVDALERLDNALDDVKHLLCPDE